MSKNLSDYQQTIESRALQGVERKIEKKRETYETYRKLKEELGEDCDRDIFYARLHEKGLSYGDIGDIEGISRSMAYKVGKRGYKKLGQHRSSSSPDR